MLIALFEYNVQCKYIRIYASAGGTIQRERIPKRVRYQNDSQNKTDSINYEPTTTARHNHNDNGNVENHNKYRKLLVIGFIEISNSVERGCDFEAHIGVDWKCIEFFSVPV
jgi:hypothetical protein